MVRASGSHVNITSRYAGAAVDVRPEGGWRVAIFTKSLGLWSQVKVFRRCGNGSFSATYGEPALWRGADATTFQPTRVCRPKTANGLQMGGAGRGGIAEDWRYQA